MAAEWRRYEVSQLITDGKLVIGDGYRATNDELSPRGLPFARAGNINEGFRFDDADHFPEQHLSRVGNKVSQPGDVVFTSKGTVGRFAFVHPTSPRFVYSPQLCFWRSLDHEAIEPRFLYYWMSGREFFVQFKGVAGQTDMAEYVSLTDQRRMHITLPCRREQRAIADILGTVDDKIALNQRMTKTLEAMALALFESWVMDFDPVCAKAADLIRDRILEIGDGYRAKNSELGETGLPFIRAGNLHDGFDTAGAALLREESAAKAGSKVSRVGDVAFTSKGTIGRVARVAQHTEQFVYSPQVCYWRSLDSSRLHPVILYCWMQSDDLKAQIAAVAGQTDMAPYVSLQDQRQMSIPIFPASQHAVASQIEPLLARQSSNVVETKTLAALRNALLPRLISGKLRVKDSGRIVGLTI
jgi:type I restriction enzyme S subunit